MKKPDHLRAFLTAALPELAREPDALSIFVNNGTIAARHGANLGFEIRYTLQLVLLDFRSAPEQLFLPLSLWLRTQQPDLLLNHESGVQAVQFRVDPVDNGAADVEVTFPLSEAVDVLPRPDGGFDMSVRDEVLPDYLQPLSDPVALLRQIWAPGPPASKFLVGHPDPDDGGD
ncbi:phage tail protein [Altererythrobacter fulvus]|uniref:phage tail protein n=1 Tax=Caenibius fulvus TaxID=2126012 RepID=UPI0030185FBC